MKYETSDRSQESAGLTVAHSYENLTKTEVPREVPVHPVLATVLAEWKLRGWKELMKRDPTPEDLVIPSRLRMVTRTKATDSPAEDQNTVG